MTPKEKAIEIFSRFDEALMTGQEAVECSVICIDAIIYNLELIHKPEYTNIFINGQYIDLYEAIEYFKEVKLEIDRL